MLQLKLPDMIYSVRHEVHTVGYEACYLLGYNATNSGRSVHTLQRSLLCHTPDNSKFMTHLTFLASVSFGSGKGVHS